MSAFYWPRLVFAKLIVPYQVADAVWNVDHAEMRVIDLTAADLDGDVKIFCTLTGEAPTYGAVQVDETLVVSHTPGDADAEDTFALENGNLSVTTARGDVYALVDGCLRANARLNGTVSASATVFASQPEDEVEFAYNHDGLRTQKVLTALDGTTTTDYTLHGKLITHQAVKKVVGETETTDEMHFFYDAQSRPAMVEFNGVLYTYMHNLQGDIIGIVDNTGTIVVEYGYDAWGKPLGEPRTLTTAYDLLAELNPFRYRGYVWDEETELYYLRSRYYDSILGKFINPDTLVGKTGKMFAHNTQKYAGNNPIRNVDCDGREEEKIQFILNVYVPIQENIDAAEIGHLSIGVRKGDKVIYFSYGPVDFDENNIYGEYKAQLTITKEENYPEKYAYNKQWILYQFTVDAEIEEVDRIIAYQAELIGSTSEGIINLMKENNKIVLPVINELTSYSLTRELGSVCRDHCENSVQGTRFWGIFFNAIWASLKDHYFPTGYLRGLENNSRLQAWVYNPPLPLPKK